MYKKEGKKQNRPTLLNITQDKVQLESGRQLTIHLTKRKRRENKKIKK